MNVAFAASPPPPPPTGPDEEAIKPSREGHGVLCLTTQDLLKLTSGTLCFW